MTIETQTSVTALRSVAPNYEHYDKFIEPEEVLELDGIRLKWYNLARRETPPPPEISRLARSFLERESSAKQLKDFGELGSVILHRCGNDFYFLLVTTWRNENELWESVYAKDGEKQPDFQPWTFQNAHRGTYCVWELVAVWHEQQAWKRYLLSGRDEAAKQVYLQDCYHGRA